ncbi:salicylate hydroxylase [Cladorrhinum sp. PSN259]|nr:salicylate hydroxylase [Cladorrhinum sp. PSN259]
MPSAIPKDEPLNVAIIGAGIAGITLALGLLRRKIPFTIYERAPSFREIGAGIGFSPNAERAMGSLSPECLSAFKKVANPNGEDYFQWVIGHPLLSNNKNNVSSPSDKEVEDHNKLLFKLHVGKDGFQGSRRSDILEAWAKLIPSSHIKFGKEVDTITDGYPGSISPITIKFKDDTEATASLVIGCDGIRSRVRQHILSKSSPAGGVAAAVNPGYTSKYCFRALVPMASATQSIGEHLSSRRFMYNGPGAHVITYPVGQNSFLNILVVISDSPSNKTWPHATHTAPGTKSEALAAFESWNPTVRRIVNLLPDDGLEKWALFDMAAHPAPTYTKGRVAIAGDAAHATGPHLGAGGGLGVEDALCLSGLLEAVKHDLESPSSSSSSSGGPSKQAYQASNTTMMMMIEKALQAYNDVRYERTQWVVRATREAADLFQWADERGKDPDQFGREITERFHKIWHYDVDEMVDEAVKAYRKQFVS